MVFVWIAVCLFLIFADQVTKYIVVINMELHESIPVIEDVLHWTYIHNYGSMGGSFANARWVFMIASTAAIIGIIVYWAIKKPKNQFLCATMTLFLAGGIGNMIDRVRLGYVVDFIDFCAFPKIWNLIFNVADSCVTIAAGMFIVYMFYDFIRDEKRKKAAKLAAAANTAGDSEMKNVSMADGVVMSDDTDGAHESDKMIDASDEKAEPLSDEHEEDGNE